MRSGVLVVVCLATVAALAATRRPDFAGAWECSPEKSKNLGMMAQVKLQDIIQQTDAALDERSISTFQGSGQEMKTHYDLTGKPASNDSPMEGPSETVSKWAANKLVTTWTSQSAVAGGAKVVRTETRSLSPDGRTMTIESVCGSNAPVVMVFDKKR
ncbi:MAG TPA: hypothetical protein VGD62_13060 [Acidobacteriaceae bacterium]